MSSLLPRSRSSAFIRMRAAKAFITARLGHAFEARQHRLGSGPGIAGQQADRQWAKLDLARGAHHDAAFQVQPLGGNRFISSVNKSVPFLVECYYECYYKPH
ncbi:MAG: hypothetical protein IPG20_14405 [Gammaproteobacteria bacterium]|nr:hypothetical protein [Gammaproteobacteria bacterium]